MAVPQLHDKYQALGNDTRYFVVTGGRGSGKSFAVNTFLAFLTMEKGHKILFTRYTMVSAATSIIPEFLEKLELFGIAKHFRITKDEILNTATGSSIIFKGIKTSSGNQTAALKSLQGITTFVLDEAEELIDEDSFDKIDQSVRDKDKQNRCILILNPTTKEHWIYQRFFAAKRVEAGSNAWKDNVTYIHTSYIDNRDHLSKSFVEQVEIMRKKNPRKYMHQIMGGWIDKAEGVVITNWRTGQFKDYHQIVYGQDYGFSTDPTTLVRCSVDTEHRIMWVQECFVKPGLSTKEIGERNLRYAGEDIIITDNNEPRMIQELREVYGCNVKGAKKGKGSILTGIALMQDYEIIVDAKSENIIKELNNYVWHARNERPIDKWNHCIDAMRYALQFAEINAKRGTYVIR